MILFKFSLELLGGWVLSAGMGRAGAEEPQDEPAQYEGSSHTSGSYTLAQGPYSTDFRDEEPWYEPEDRFGFH